MLEVIERPVKNKTIEIYNLAFDQAEMGAREAFSALTVKREQFEPILQGARRIGRVMGKQFPSFDQVSWIRDDVNFMVDSSLEVTDVLNVLKTVEKIIWSYQPVWETFAQGTFLRLGQDVAIEEIEMEAQKIAEELIHWRWHPEMPNPEKQLSKGLASNLAHLLTEVIRKTPYNLSFSAIREDYTPNSYENNPEEYVLMKETVREALQLTQLTPEQIYVRLDESASKIERLTNNFFPVQLTHPESMWSLVKELLPRERLAMLHNLGYLYAEATSAKLEQDIGLKPGHLRSILREAREKIIKLWFTDHYESQRLSLDDIRQLLSETITEGAQVYHLKNGRIDRSATRQRLRQMAEAGGESFFSALSFRKQEIVRLLIDGYTSDEVGNMLGISPKTVRDHASVVISKYPQLC